MVASFVWALEYIAATWSTCAIAKLLSQQASHQSLLGLFHSPPAFLWIGARCFHSHFAVIGGVTNRGSTRGRSAPYDAGQEGASLADFFQPVVIPVNGFDKDKDLPLTTPISVQAWPSPSCPCQCLAVTIVPLSVRGHTAAPLKQGSQESERTTR